MFQVKWRQGSIGPLPELSRQERGAEWWHQREPGGGSLLDYCIPRADDLPSFTVSTRETPCPHNPLGVKGAGECGTVGALPAVMNAINDAIQPFGKHVSDMPFTPERILKALGKV